MQCCRKQLHRAKLTGSSLVAHCGACNHSLGMQLSNLTRYAPAERRPAPKIYMVHLLSALQGVQTAQGRTAGHLPGRVGIVYSENRCSTHVQLGRIRRKARKHACQDTHQAKDRQEYTLRSCTRAGEEPWIAQHCGSWSLAQNTG